MNQKNFVLISILSILYAVTIGKIENGDLRPSDKIVKKLEKELNIVLVEDVKSVSNVSMGSQSGRGLTLGDFIKKEE